MITADDIQAWFDTGAPFEEGLALYHQLPKQDNRVLRSLSRGKNSYNKSLLIKELRAYKNKPSSVEKKLKPTVSKPKPTQPTTDVSIAKDHQETSLKITAEKRFFAPIKYAELPPELRIRHRQVRDLFYQMCDLKFVLNDVPAQSQKEALAIQLQIEELDEQKSMIWRELEHWQNHKTMLPSDVADFSELDKGELRLKYGNLKSQIKKMSDRINENYELLFATEEAQEKRKLERKINTSEKKLHQHQLNLLRIKELL